MVAGGARADDARAHDLVIRILVVYAAAYIALAASGAYVFIFKTVLIPAFAIYAIGSREIALFVRAWFPFLAATVLFDVLRGTIFTLVRLGYRPVFAEYPIVLERWVAGTPAATIPLQEHLRSPLMDRIMVGLHGAHFVFFLLFGLAVWHIRREWFVFYRRSLLGIFYGGLLCYLLVPTAPPWIASKDLGLLPPIDHIVRSTYNLEAPELLGAFDTNPVAAMPSLHAAFPVACMVVAWRAFAWPVAAGATLYTILTSVAVVYLGEHYLVDVLAGWIFAFLVCGVVSRLDPPRGTPTLRAALLWSAIVVAGAMALVAAGSW